MKASEIRSARKERNLSQEKLAEIMQVDVTTVYRWEAGIVAPSLANLMHLRDILSQFDGLRHPLMQFLLDQSEATALLDREGVYREANQSFLKQVRLDADRLIGHYAPDCLDVWDNHILAETGSRPEDLAIGDFAEVTVVSRGPATPPGQAACHRINIVRQEKFSVVIVHGIELLAANETPHPGVTVTRRFGASG